MNIHEHETKIEERIEVPKKVWLTGTIEFTDREIMRLKQKKCCYKMINKHWFKLIRKSGTEKKVRLAKKTLANLEKKIAKLKEVINGKSV